MKPFISMTTIQASSRASSQPHQREPSAEAQYWDNFESGIYRRPMINEKAFMSTVTRTNKQSTTVPVPNGEL